MKSKASLRIPCFSEAAFRIFLDPDQLRTKVNQCFYRPRSCESKLQVVPNHFKTVTLTVTLKSVDIQLNSLKSAWWNCSIVLCTKLNDLLSLLHVFYIRTNYIRT